MADADAHPDEAVARLADLFANNPAWRQAARFLARDAASDVWFRHRPGERWQLGFVGDRVALRRGPATRPDFVFCFTPESVAELERAGEDVQDVAVRLFELMLDPDEARQVRLRIVAPLSRLLRKGYVRLLLGSGPKVLVFAANHGVSGLRPLRDLVHALRRTEPEPWEVAVSQPPTGPPTP